MMGKDFLRFALTACCAVLVFGLIGLATGCKKGSTGGGGTTSKETANKRIAVIPKGTTHPFWKSVEAGAMQAGKETGYEIIWKGALVESDRSQQVQI
ncbi:MAG: hypothetical protein D6820_10100, partial [Lentisphaerae bacterium]